MIIFKYKKYNIYCSFQLIGFLDYFAPGLRLGLRPGLRPGLLLLSFGYQVTRNVDAVRFRIQAPRANM